MTVTCLKISRKKKKTSVHDYKNVIYTLKKSLLKHKATFGLQEETQLHLVFLNK